MAGVRGPYGQRAQLVAVQGPERESDRASTLLRKMAGNLAAVLNNKWETAVIDLARVSTVVLTALRIWR